MFRDSTVYSVKYSEYSNSWTVYVDGMPMAKSENPGGIGGQYNHHEYGKKRDAVEKARKFAKQEADRDNAVQLKVFNKSGSKTTEVSNYGKYARYD